MTTNQPDQAAGLRKMTANPKPAPQPIRVVSVTSGKGGVGKTNIVANLAITLSRQGYRVLVMDADLSLANVDVLLGLAPEYHIGHVLSGERMISEVIVEGPGGMMILPASSGVQELTNLSDAEKLTLLDQMDGLEDQIDILFIDTAAGIGGNVMYFNLAAQERMVVVTPEPTSLTDAYALIKVLFTQHRENYYRILINEARDAAEAKDVFRKLAAVADRFLPGVSLDYLGFIPLDQNVPKSVRLQKPVVEAFPQSPASQSFKTLAKNLLSGQRRGKLEGNIRFFWKRLFAIQDQDRG